jgi:hypothetical protein
MGFPTLRTLCHCPTHPHQKRLYHPPQDIRDCLKRLRRHQRNYAKNADLQDAVATLNLLLQSKADLTALESKVSNATFQTAIANLGTLIEGQIDPTELSIALGQFAQAQPQQLIRQSKVFEFKGVYSTNSTAFSAVGISASLPQPLLSTSKVRARFSGYAAIQSNSPRGLFTMARGTTLLHPSGRKAWRNAVGKMQLRSNLLFKMMCQVCQILSMHCSLS